MMHMTFYWGKRVTLLFDSWKTDSWISYSLTLLAVFLFSVFYQFMEVRRLRIKISALPSAKQSSAPLDAPLLASRFYGAGKSSHLAGALLFGLNSALGYLLMLAIMSYNGGVFVAVVLGLFFGYLIFRSGDEEVVVLDNPCACA